MPKIGRWEPAIENLRYKLGRRKGIVEFGAPDCIRVTLSTIWQMVCKPEIDKLLTSFVTRNLLESDPQVLDFSDSDSRTQFHREKCPTGPT